MWELVLFYPVSEAAASSVPRPVAEAAWLEAEKKQQALIRPPPERKASPEQLQALVAAMSLLEAPV